MIPTQQAALLTLPTRSPTLIAMFPSPNSFLSDLAFLCPVV